MDEWVIETLEKLGASAPFGNGRAQLRLAFDGFMLPKEKVVSLYEQARRLGTKVITSHHAQSYFGEHIIQPMKWLMTHEGFGKPPACKQT